MSNVLWLDLPCLHKWVEYSEPGTTWQDCEECGAWEFLETKEPAS